MTDEQEAEAVESVMCPQGITVSLNKKDYKWPQPKGKIQRLMMRRATKIGALMSRMAETDGESFFDAVELVVDFLAEFNGAMRRDKKDIENEDGDKLIKAFIEIQDGLLKDPLLKIQGVAGIKDQE